MSPQTGHSAKNMFNQQSISCILSLPNVMDINIIVGFINAGASHSGMSSPWLLYRSENFTLVRNLPTVSCKHETTAHFGVKSVCW